MKRRIVALWFAVASATACDAGQDRSDPLAVAESFIDAFYAWDGERLSALLAPGREADKVLYYQGWAEAAHYQVKQRQPCYPSDGHEVVCAVTVTDDFGTALGYTATDTFTMTIGNGRVAAISFAGDDPPVFEELFEWLTSTRPQVFTGPCNGMFDQGTTPGDCARAIAQGARDFAHLGPDDR